MTQSVVSRELAQLEDLLEWAIGCHGNEHQDVMTGQEMKEQAYRVQKVSRKGMCIHFVCVCVFEG